MPAHARNMIVVYRNISFLECFFFIYLCRLGRAQVLMDTHNMCAMSTTNIRRVILLPVIVKLTSDDGGGGMTVCNHNSMFGVVDVGNCMFTISFKRIVVVKCDDYSNFFN